MQPVFVGFLQLSPSLLGITQAATRLTSGLTDSYFGWRSDNTRTRWGRRRPYILVGSLLAAFALGWYPLNRRTMDAVRARLEARRGTV
jgi:glycoside/pentoside/hexuronide:cation symporter, GPH family